MKDQTLGDVIKTILQILKLVGGKTRTKIVIIALFSASLAALEMLALFLLVPLLGLMSDQATSKSKFVINIENVINKFFGNADTNQVAIALAVIAILVYLLKGAASITLIWKQTALLSRAESDLSARIVRSYTNAKWVAKQDINQGTLIHGAMSASANTTITILNSVIALTTDTATCLFLFAAIMIINPWVSISIALFLTVVSTLYLSFIKRAISTKSLKIQNLGERMNDSLIELSGAIKEVNVRSTNDVFIERYTFVNREFRKESKLLSALNQSMRYLLESSLFIGVGLVLVAGYKLADFDAVKLTLGIILISGLRLIPALNSLFVNINQIRINQGAYSYVKDLLDVLEPEFETTEKVDYESDDIHFDGSFEFKNVSFRYKASESNVLDQISFRVDAGESIGIIGESGAGKSTLVDLLLGVIEPTEGNILINGVDISNVKMKWRKSVGYVPQNVYILNDTVSENIRMGLESLNESETGLLNAISKAGLDDFVAELPDGLNSNVGERGSKMSGGERQRMGIARALYSMPKTLIFDEATSSLDNLTQEKFTSTLKRISRGRTVVIVAHRLNTVVHCNKILFLDDGKVAGYSSFDELMTSNSKFVELVNLGKM